MPLASETGTSLCNKKAQNWRTRKPVVLISSAPLFTHGAIVNALRVSVPEHANVLCVSVCISSFALSNGEQR